MIYEDETMTIRFCEARIDKEKAEQVAFCGFAPKSLADHFAECASGIPFAHVWVLPPNENDMVEYEAVGSKRLAQYCLMLTNAHNACR